jgi:hypothetical protein
MTCDDCGKDHPEPSLLDENVPLTVALTLATIQASNVLTALVGLGELMGAKSSREIAPKLTEFAARLEHEIENNSDLSAEDTLHGRGLVSMFRAMSYMADAIEVNILGLGRGDN